MKKRIPTIFDEESLPSSEIHPTEAEIQAVLNRLQETEDLFQELKTLKIDLKELAHLIALNLHEKEVWEHSYKEKEKASDNTKKTKRRWKKQPPGDRQSQIKKATRIEARILFAVDTMAALAPEQTKKRPYLIGFLYDLKFIFYEKTQRPYRYMAAIFNVYNFHSEKFCNGCEKFNTKTRLCDRKRIFTCPETDKVRNKIRKQVTRITEPIPTARYPQ